MKNNIKNLAPQILIGLYPVALLVGTLISEIITIFLILFFIFEIFSNKINTKFFSDKIIYTLIILWIFLLINLFNSTDWDASFSRAVTFIRFPLLILAISYFLNDDIKLRTVFNIWAITLTIIIFDLYFQYFMGFNTLGYVSPFPGRLSGFSHDELNIAHLLIGFFIPTLVYFFTNKIFFISNKSNILFFSTILILYLVIILLINERANGIRAILIIFIFLIMSNFIKRSYKFLTVLIFTITILLTIFFNSNTKHRFISEIANMNVKNNSLSQYILLSNYGPHYVAGYEVFKKFPIIGSGLKTFRMQCRFVNTKQYYIKSGLVDTELYENRCVTHPHQIYIEFLSETGILVFFLFFIFFIYFLYRGFSFYFKKQNLILLSFCLYIISQLIPLLPSGSFFTSFGATIFWINIAMAYLLIKKN